jgi:hypothetical protein
MTAAHTSDRTRGLIPLHSPSEHAANGQQLIMFEFFAGNYRWSYITWAALAAGAEFGDDRLRASGGRDGPGTKPGLGWPIPRMNQTRRRTLRPRPLAPKFGGSTSACAISGWSVSAGYLHQSEWSGIRGTVRFLQRHEHGRGQAPSFGGVAETCVARNRGERVAPMDI